MSDLAQQIKQAMGSHGCWKLQLSEAVAKGRLSSSSLVISRDDLCTFGKWLRQLSQDPVVANAAEYRLVVEAHARFHKAAGQIARCVENGEVEAAAALLNGSDFQKISDRLTSTMADWRQSLQPGVSHGA